MALENIAGVMSVQRRWVLAFAFGLVHGFGFSFALRETLQFAGSHLVTSLLAFNVGVEMGQLLVLALLVPALQLLFRYRGRRAYGHDHPVGAGRPHGLALDRRTLGAAPPVRGAGVKPVLLARGLRWLIARRRGRRPAWLIAALVRRKNHDPAVN